MVGAQQLIEVEEIIVEQVQPLPLEQRDVEGCEVRVDQLGRKELLSDEEAADDVCP